MKVTLIAAALASVVPAHGGLPARPLYTAKSGSTAVDQFISWVQHGDETEIARTAKFGTLSGRYPQFKTSAEYLAWVDDCRISRVARNGVDAAGNVVSIDPSLRTGPAVVQEMGPVYWVYWDCPKGKFRQALNAAFEWPKVLVSEMLVRERELLWMRPKEKVTR
jgi:hypothetical protein